MEQTTRLLLLRLDLLAYQAFRDKLSYILLHAIPKENPFYVFIHFVPTWVYGQLRMVRFFENDFYQMPWFWDT